jgi:outer membrane receptor for ferrienterochelin and colicins
MNFLTEKVVVLCRYVSNFLSTKFVLMKAKIIYTMLLVWGVALSVVANNPHHYQEGNSIYGHVIVKGTETYLSDAIVVIEETGKRMVSGADGKFVVRDLPAGEYTVSVHLVGYNDVVKKVTVSAEYSVDVHFEMEEVNIMDEVVVSASRNAVRRSMAPVVVNVMNQQTFERVNATDIAQTLNYQTGLRVENSCQNCAFP